MKKLFSVLFCLLLLVSLAACNQKTDTSLYEQGREIIALLDELAGNEEAIAAYSASPRISEILQNAVMEPHGTPKTVYALTGDNLMQLPQGISENLTVFLTQRALSALPTQVNGMAGVEVLAASSVCTVGRTFLCPESQDVIYLYIYDTAVPVAVTFTAGEDSTVSASGTFLLNPDFPTGSAQEIQAFFEGTVTVSEVPYES